MADRGAIAASHYVGTAAANYFILLCTLLQGVLLARMLGPGGRGAYAAVTYWPTLFATIGLFGTNIALARRAGAGDGGPATVMTAVSSAAATSVLTTVLCGIALPVMLPHSMSGVRPLAYLFLAVIPLHQMMMNLQGIDQGAGHFSRYNSGRIALYPVFLAGLLAVWLAQSSGLGWILAALLIAHAVPLCIRLVQGRGELHEAGGRTDVRTLVAEGIPYWWSTLIAVGHQQIDKALILWMLPAESIGIYAVAYSSGGVVQMTSSALGTVVFTESARMQPAEGFAVIARTVRRAGVLAAAGGAILVLFMPLVLPLVYGDAFAAAVPTAQILVCGFACAGLGEILNQALRGQGRPIAGAAGRLLAMVAIGASSALLAGSRGTAGVAVGVLLGEAVCLGALCAAALRHFGDASLRQLVPAWADVIELLQAARRRM